MENKTIVAIGDIHGRRKWQKIIEKEKDADYIVFVGDYFDTHESVSAMVQIVNFQKILQFKKENSDKVVLLMGNHDFHYLSEMNERYSGFNEKYKVEIEKEVKKALEDGDMQYCFVIDGFVFTHAGITRTWALENEVDLNNLQESIHDLELEAFKFNRKDLSGYGDSSTQSPIWVRPLSLIIDAISGYTQVVGHTTHNTLTERQGVYFIDCLGTSEEYLKIIGSKVTIEKIKNENI